ncbi:MAG: hypothetical protein DDT19_00004 [Syntrophomonadaceae bacterium]|nr:hypothetical protein [Bacillota bacterium]
MKVKTKTIGVPQCQACNSKNMITKRTGESWCRRCGWSGRIVKTINIKEEKK